MSIVPLPKTHIFRLTTALSFLCVIVACGGASSNEPTLPDSVDTDTENRPVTDISQASGNWRLISSAFVDEDTPSNSQDRQDVLQINASGDVSNYFVRERANGNPCYVANRRLNAITSLGDGNYEWRTASGFQEQLTMGFVRNQLVLGFQSGPEIYVAAEVTQDQLDDQCLEPLESGFSLVKTPDEISGVWESLESMAPTFLIIDNTERLEELTLDENPQFDDQECFRESSFLTGQIRAVGEGIFFLTGTTGEIDTFRLSQNAASARLNLDAPTFDVRYGASDRDINQFSARCRDQVDFYRSVGQPLESLDELQGVWDVIFGANNESSEELFYAFDNQGIYTLIDFQGDDVDRGEPCYQKTSTSTFEALGGGRFLQIFNGGTTDEIEMYLYEGELLIVRPNFFDARVERVAVSRRLLSDFTPTCPS